MRGEQPPPSSGSSTTVTDLDVDSLAHCASYLSLRDVSNMAISCAYLNGVAYSDSIWQSLYRKEWPHIVPLFSKESSIREAYLSRHIALNQFKYADPQLFESYDPTYYLTKAPLYYLRVHQYTPRGPITLLIRHFISTARLCF